MRRISLLLLLLAGCGQNDNHGFGFDFDQQSEVTGARVRLANENSLSIDEIDAVYSKLSACTGIGIPPPGPLVIFTDPTLIPDHEAGNDGWYFEDTRTALVSSALLKYPDGTAELKTSHELMHFLLHVSTGDLDPNHRSPLWIQCPWLP